MLLVEEQARTCSMGHHARVSYKILARRPWAGSWHVSHSEVSDVLWLWLGAPDAGGLRWHIDIGINSNHTHTPGRCYSGAVLISNSPASCALLLPLLPPSPAPCSCPCPQSPPLLGAQAPAPCLARGDGGAVPACREGGEAGGVSEVHGYWSWGGVEVHCTGACEVTCTQGPDVAAYSAGMMRAVPNEAYMTSPCR